MYGEKFRAPTWHNDSLQKNKKSHYTEHYADRTVFMLQGKYMSYVMKNLVLPYANNKGADQPAHPRTSTQSDQRLCCSLPR